VRTTRFPSNRERRASPAPGRQTRQRRAGSAVVARWRVLVALILAGGLVAGACSVNSSASNGDRASLIRSSTAGGWIRIGAAPALHFETTTCSAQRNRFVAVGVGMDGNRKFLVRVRAKNVLEVRFGTHDEMELDSSDNHMLVAKPADVEADGHVIRGTALLLDSAKPEQPLVPAELRVYCGD